MPNLIVKFEGMSLIVKANGRSEALFVDPEKAGSNHQHAHEATGGGPPVPMRDVLVWIEANGRRLDGPIANTPSLVANLNELVPNEPLKPFLETNTPETQQGWRALLDAWVRLPGGTLTSQETNTTGGQVEWIFAAQNGQPEVKRRLTQFCSLTRANVTGPVTLAVQSMNSGEITRTDVPLSGNAFTIDLRTLFSGDDPGEPNPGDVVELQELELLYKCLKSERMRIPSVVWPSASPGGGLQILTDPFTGICPDGIMQI